MDTLDVTSFRDLAVEEFNTTTMLAHARQQAQQRRYEDFPIVDVDGHHLETISFAQIIEYIEELKPEPRLIPADPKERAYALALALMNVADSHPLVTPRVRNHLAKTFGADAHAIEEWGKHWSTEGLATYERLLARRPPAPFALGAEPGLADICIATQVVGAQYVKLDLAAFPIVAKLAERCFALPAFASSHPFEQPGYKVANTPR